MLPEPLICTVSAKTLVGDMLEMSFDNIQTPILWRNFMPRRNQISNAISSDLYSVQILKKFEVPTPQSEFEKWACVEVTEVADIPQNMKLLTIPEGLYAIFHYNGSDTEGYKVFQWIFNQWLPNTIYEFDNRPQFEILNEKYKRNNVDSEEDIYIPIKFKKADQFSY
jgi:AraC family transcriptional regulator